MTGIAFAVELVSFLVVASSLSAFDAYGVPGGQEVPGSVRVADMPAGEAPAFGDSFVFWPLGPQSLLLLTAPKPYGGRSPFGASSPHRLHAYLIGLATHRVERAPDVERLLSSELWSGVSVSTDGKEVVCVPGDRRHAGRWVDLLTRTSTPLPLIENSTVAWLPGSRSLLDLYLQSHPPRSSRIISLVPVVSQKDLAATVDGDRPIGEEIGTPLGITPDRTLVCASTSLLSDGVIGRQVVDVREFRLDDLELRQGPSFSFIPPELEFGAESMRLNSQGTQVLWQGLARADRDRWMWRLYVSSPDGSNIRLIADVPVGPSAGPRPVSGADWLPDGKSICFTVDGAIYLVLM